jgi:hypothetical protein
MQPGVHERKWEVDSLCYPIRLAYGYWKTTKEVEPFDKTWKTAMLLIFKTFREQQRKEGRGPYAFQRCDDVLCENGYGRPVFANGMICSAFHPSDNATIFPFLVPANWFAVVSLRQADEQSRCLGRRAHVGGVELGKRRVEPRPVDLLCQDHQRMVWIEQLVEVGVKQIELVAVSLGAWSHRAPELQETEGVAINILQVLHVRLHHSTLSLPRNTHNFRDD